MSHVSCIGTITKFQNLFTYYSGKFQIAERRKKIVGQIYKNRAKFATSNKLAEVNDNWILKNTFKLAQILQKSPI